MGADLTAATRRWEQLLGGGRSGVVAGLLGSQRCGVRLQSEMQMGNYSRLCVESCAAAL